MISFSIYPHIFKINIQSYILQNGKRKLQNNYFFLKAYWKWMKENDWNQNNWPPNEDNAAFNLTFI